MTGFSDILGKISQYYADKVNAHGPTHWGVDWNSTESQTLRFAQLLRIAEGAGPFSINDYGCGYGALASYLARQRSNFTYHGYDIVEAMIGHAQRLLSGNPNCFFYADPDQLPISDYTVASGIFNVKLGVDPAQWQAYTLETIRALAQHSSRGFAFNMVSLYAEADPQRPDLYHADPLFYFEHCCTTYSRYVALLHDYPLPEFTLLVRLA